MDFLSLFGTAVALAMDAFTVALVTGACNRKPSFRQFFRMSFHFGLFQALMPVLGWIGGSAIYQYISKAGAWLAFGILASIGLKMMLSGLRGNRGDLRNIGDMTRGWRLAALSLATSMDALAVGFSLAVVGSGIVVPAVVIGVVAAAFTVAGMAMGAKVGALWGSRMEIAGGLLLVAIGTKLAF